MAPICTFAEASKLLKASATPDGKVVIAGGQDGVLRVWNGADGKMIKEFTPPVATRSVAKK